MTERLAAVLALPGPAQGAPPGVDPDDYRLALFEDTYEVAADMGQVTAVLAVAPQVPNGKGPDEWGGDGVDPRQDAGSGAGRLDGRGDLSGPEVRVWPGTPILHLRGLPAASPASAGPASSATPETVIATLRGLAQLGGDEGAVLAPDAPDLPVMLLGKLFQGLEHGEVSVCPARDGGLVALASRLPVPEWLHSAGVGLDSEQAVAMLRAAAPTRRALAVTPGWRRLRQPEDIAHLDPGLEGWETTRALLSGR